MEDNNNNLKNGDDNATFNENHSSFNYNVKNF